MQPIDSNTREFSAAFAQPQLAAPNSTGVLVLGILSIIFAGLIGLILGIIALNMAGSARAAVAAEPARYTKSSVSNLNAGRVCGIIGVSISGLVLLIVIIAIAAS